MVTTLLGLLAANAHKTPDQIVSILQSKAWIKGENMTQAQYEYLCEKGRVGLTLWHGSGDWWKHSHSTYYNMNDWALRVINQSLGDYWFIAWGEYDGETFPDWTPDQASG